MLAHVKYKYCVHIVGINGLTSMSKSSSILTALPKMKMYCMRFANSHMFLSRVNSPGSCAGCDDSISALPRFRETIVTKLKEINRRRKCSVKS